MTPDELAEWIAIGLQLRGASPERFAEIVTTLRTTADACGTIAAYDEQLMLRIGRPTKRYQA